MKTICERVTDKKEVICMLDEALELLIQDLSCSEALEYCADQIELTKLLEGIAENLTYTAFA
jgi:hypothetical protein